MSDAIPSRVQPWLDDGDVQLYHGDVIQTLRALPAGIAQTCVTSPPYWGLRDYGTGEWAGGSADCDHQRPFSEATVTSSGLNLAKNRDEIQSNVGSKHGNGAYRDTCGKCGARRLDSQLGLEPTPQAYVERMVAVFREVWRVLRDDGTVWLNLGDSYYSPTATQGRNENRTLTTSLMGHGANGRSPALDAQTSATFARTVAGLKPKDLVGVPWAVAKALQAPFYSGRIKAERDRVWLAATIDAEGSICGFHHTRKDDGSTRTGIHLTITNTNMALLAEAQRIWPTSRDDGHAHGPSALGDRECRRWIAFGVEDKAALLQELYPHLIAKRQQALLAWNFLEMSKLSKRIGKLAEGQQAKERRSWIVHALSALNRGDGVDLPPWIAEPPTLFEDGWYLRSDIVWSKPNPMPESVSDRPTKAHEYLFLLTKQPRYFYDFDAIREDFTGHFGQAGGTYLKQATPKVNADRNDGGGYMGRPDGAAGRNRRSVWTIPTQPFHEAHFATYPEELVRPCIQAGTSEKGECSECGAPWTREVDRGPAYPGAGWGEGRQSANEMINDGERRSNMSGALHAAWKRAHPDRDLGWRPSCSCEAATRPQTVLDPFIGSGTTALVARKHGRRCIGIDLSAEYLGIAARRLQQLSLFADGLGRSEDTPEAECAS